MKKGQVAIFIIIAILLAVAFVLFFVLRSEKDIGLKFECETDSDCVVVQTGCCSCTMGGTEVCVAESEKENYEADLDSCPDDLNCIAMIGDCISECSCVKNECIGQ